MTREFDAVAGLSDNGHPDADRRLAENFGMTVRQVQEFDPQTLDVARACKFLGLPPKRFDQLAAQAEERGRWVATVARQRKDLIETFPEAGKDVKELLEAIRKFALRKCLNPDGPALAEGSRASGANGRSKSRTGGNGQRHLLLGFGVAAAVLLIGGLVAVLMPARGNPQVGPDAVAQAPVTPLVNKTPDPPPAAALPPQPEAEVKPPAVRPAADRVTPTVPPAKKDPDRTAATYVLSVGGVVRLKGSTATTNSLDRLPKEPFRLGSAIIRDGGRVTDDGLKAFEGVRDLSVITILKSPVTANGVSHLKECNDLVTIAISGPAVDDAVMSHFADCKKLRQIWIGGTKVTDKGMTTFHKLKNLEFLDVNNTAVTDDGLIDFAGIATLKLLSLSNTGVSDKGLASFKDCKKLETLHLESTRVTDKSISTLRTFTELRSLKINKTGVTPEGVKRLARLLPNCKLE